eukprot:4752020-Pyramimonas_sp.AAC.1
MPALTADVAVVNSAREVAQGPLLLHSLLLHPPTSNLFSALPHAAGVAIAPPCFLQSGKGSAIFRAAEHGAIGSLGIESTLRLAPSIKYITLAEIPNKCKANRKKVAH